MVLRPCGCILSAESVWLSISSNPSQAGLQTLTVRLGVRTVFWLCIGLLQVAYLGGCCLALWCKVRNVFLERISL